MITFLYIVLFFIIIDIVIWYLVAKYKVKDNFIDVVLDNKKNFLYSILFVVVLVTLVCSVKLYHVASCQVHSVITNADTQYSWILNQCQAKNSSGVYVDINRTRGIPGDDDSTE